MIAAKKLDIRALARGIVIDQTGIEDANAHRLMELTIINCLGTLHSGDEAREELRTIMRQFAMRWKTKLMEKTVEEQINNI